jgi:hypothetical protein
MSRDDLAALDRLAHRAARAFLPAVACFCAAFALGLWAVTR